MFTRNPNRTRVSVIIATYNRSNVLKYAIQSVLAQTLREFQLLVVGDACTDDTEEVVHSFRDKRIRWHNLEENSGSQAIPNNVGLAMATGDYVAYLGQDDVWHPKHLQFQVETAERTGAKFVTAITLDVGPTGTQNLIWGVGDNVFFAPPSSWLHHRSIIENIGQWRNYREIIVPPDLDLVMRWQQTGERLTSSRRLTVVKFNSSRYSQSYSQRTVQGQKDFLQRLRSDSDFYHVELLRVIEDIFHTNPQVAPRPRASGVTLRAGSAVEEFRARRGLPAKDAVPPPPEMTVPLWEDVHALRFVNEQEDISPLAGRQSLLLHDSLDADGLLVGGNWYAVEHNPWGFIYRWATNDAEIVVTKPAHRTRQLYFEVMTGPGVDNAPFTLLLLDVDGSTIASFRVSGIQTCMAVVHLPASSGTIFRLHTNDGGKTIDGDARIMNFGILRFGWLNEADNSV